MKMSQLQGFFFKDYDPFLGTNSKIKTATIEVVTHTYK